MVRGIAVEHGGVCGPEVSPVNTVDIQAVCARHGVTLWPDRVFHAKPKGASMDEAVSGPSKEQAVCKLLKARWRITTRPTPSRDNTSLWAAYTYDGSHEAESGADEFGAVVSLADVLAGFA